MKSSGCLFAIVTGAVPHTSLRRLVHCIALGSVTLDMLGTAERIVCAKGMSTIITDGIQEEAIEARIAQIRLEAENDDTDFDKEMATERIAVLYLVAKIPYEMSEEVK